VIPRPIRYRASRQPDGEVRVEFQQSEGDRWFPLAEIEDGLSFGWGGGEHGHIEHVRHLAAALLLSRVSSNEACAIVDDMADLVLRMPAGGWEMSGQALGTVISRLVTGRPIPDPAFQLDIVEQRLATLFGGGVPHG
jgi:hypothetical protein